MASPTNPSLSLPSPLHDFRNKKMESGAPTQSFRLLDLPPEIYQMILRLILIPGKVYPRPPIQPVQGNSDLAIPSHQKSYPGFQILATRKQIHDEGERLFYSNNIFYLPRRSAENGKSYFNSLLPRHRSLIRYIAIRFSITDLPPFLLHPGCTFNISPILRSQWRAKLKWACLWHRDQTLLGNPGLNEITMEDTAGGRRLSLCRSKIAEYLKLQNNKKSKFPSSFGDLLGLTPCTDPLIRELTAFLLKIETEIAGKLPATGIDQRFEWSDAVNKLFVEMAGLEDSEQQCE